MYIKNGCDVSALELISYLCKTDGKFSIVTNSSQDTHNIFFYVHPERSFNIEFSSKDEMNEFVSNHPGIPFNEFKHYFYYGDKKLEQARKTLIKKHFENYKNSINRYSI